MATTKVFCRGRHDLVDLLRTVNGVTIGTHTQASLQHNKFTAEIKGDTEAVEIVVTNGMAMDFLLKFKARWTTTLEISAIEGKVGPEPLDATWYVSGTDMRFNCNKNQPFWLELTLPFDIPDDYYLDNEGAFPPSESPEPGEILDPMPIEQVGRVMGYDQLYRE